MQSIDRSQDKCIEQFINYANYILKLNSNPEYPDYECVTKKWDEGFCFALALIFSFMGAYGYQCLGEWKSKIKTIATYDFLKDNKTDLYIFEIVMGHALWLHGDKGKIFSQTKTNLIDKFIENKKLNPNDFSFDQYDLLKSYNPFFETIAGEKIKSKYVIVGTFEKSLFQKLLKNCNAFAQKAIYLIENVGHTCSFRYYVQSYNPSNGPLKKHLATTSSLPCCANTAWGFYNPSHKLGEEYFGSINTLAGRIFEKLGHHLVIKIMTWSGGVNVKEINKAVGMYHDMLDKHTKKLLTPEACHVIIERGIDLFVEFLEYSDPKRLKIRNQLISSIKEIGNDIIDLIDQTYNASVFEKFKEIANVVVVKCEYNKESISIFYFDWDEINLKDLKEKIAKKLKINLRNFNLYTNTNASRKIRSDYFFKRIGNTVKKRRELKLLAKGEIVKIDCQYYKEDAGVVKNFITFNKLSSLQDLKVKIKDIFPFYDTNFELIDCVDNDYYQILGQSLNSEANFQDWVSTISNHNMNTPKIFIETKGQFDLSSNGNDTDSDSEDSFIMRPRMSRDDDSDMDSDDYYINSAAFFNYINSDDKGSNNKPSVTNPGLKK